MEDDKIVNLDTPNETEKNQEDSVINLDENLSAEEKLEFVIKQNAKMFERAKKAEGFEKQPDGSWVKKSKPAPLQTQKKDDSDIHKTVAELALAEKKRQFGYANGLSPEETDAIFKINSNPTKEVLEDPFVKGGLAQLRAKARVENNTPSSSSRSAKPLTFKADATPAEKQQAHDEWVKQWQAKR